MYCSKCNKWVETSNNVDSVKCDSCSDIIYDLQKQSPSRELTRNQYYLIVAKNGFILMTKYKPEAKIISGWEGIIFSGIVDRANHSIVYTTNGTEHIEKLKNIHASAPYSRSFCFDFQTLKNSGTIKKVSIQKNIRSKYAKSSHPLK